ncbi:MAG TPA: CbbQ/NirQ/NorQ/GpvN family protein [Dissulfurispiraceae bacterium]|nr:CbbQ/NirQ/NorQ/GpvN family protein [Dissulfurispiraceae bacterium]
MKAKAVKSDQYLVETEPYYRPVANEIDLFEAAYRNRIPVLMKGPTGSGKTRFMQYVAWKYHRPLITVSCHDDLTASDLVGRYLVKGGETIWVDGPLTKAVKAGGFCYLDEIVEARKDTTVVIHPLADDRRILPVEKRGKIFRAPDEFLLAISYNPGYQSVLKDLKQSTRQRFLALDFGYPGKELEVEIIMHESGIDVETAGRLVSYGKKTRNLKDRGLAEGASTRLLIHAAQLVVSGIKPTEACKVAVSAPLTDDAEMIAALDEIVSSLF